MPSSTPSPREINRASLLAIRLLALVGLSVYGYLAWVTFTHGTIAACDGESSHIACGHVLRSTWSRLLGIPVSLFGSVVYS